MENPTDTQKEAIEHNPNLPSINESYDKIGIDCSIEMSGVLDRDHPKLSKFKEGQTVYHKELGPVEITEIRADNYDFDVSLIVLPKDGFRQGVWEGDCSVEPRPVMRNEEQLKTFSKAITMYLDGCPMTDTHYGQVQKLIDAGFRITKI